MWATISALFTSLLLFFEKLASKTLMPIVERGYIPDFLIRFAIRLMLMGKLREEVSSNAEEQIKRKTAFVQELKKLPIAIHTEDANKQHYEVPAEFFSIVLGPWKKYSCCLYPTGKEDLLAAEEAMLNLVCERADLKDGQTVLDLGCGWASCALFMATKFPRSNVVGISNSHSQRLHNENEAKRRGLNNVKFVTSDINSFNPLQSNLGPFDRIVSNEMFEHMKNYEQLLKRVSQWLKPQGKLFVHIFTHKDVAYHFKDGWMAETFFSGGTMPSDDLLLYFADDVAIENHWRVNGVHYKKTLDAWLKRMDDNYSKVMPIIRSTYGEGNEYKWYFYWRLFFLACSECFGYNKGNEWIVSHYLFTRRSSAQDERKTN